MFHDFSKIDDNNSREKEHGLLSFFPSFFFSSPNGRITSITQNWSYLKWNNISKKKKKKKKKKP